MKKLILLFFVAAFVSDCSGSIPDPSPLEEPPQTESPQVFPTTSSPELLSEVDDVLTYLDLNSIPPDDVIQEITYLGRPGGGGDITCFGSDYRVPTFALDYANQNELIEVFSSVSTKICGLPPGEKVNIQAKLPDGSIHNYLSFSYQWEGQDHAETNFEYIPNLHDPIGKHVLTFSGTNWILERTLNIVDADSARLYLVDGKKLVFYKFKPNERVRLFAYHDISSKLQKLIGWKEFQLDEKGELSVDVDMEEDTRFVAVGEISGQVIYRTPNDDSGYTYWLNVYTSDFYCPGVAKVTGIEPLGYAQTLTDTIPTYKYDPSKNDWVKDDNIKIGKGTLVTITSNATCYDGSFLWTVSCVNKNCDISIPESGPDGPYLRPLGALPATPTLDPSNVPACSGTKPTRLQVGMNAEVTTSGAAPQLSLRAQPSMSANKVHVIAAGRDIVILQGPVCADNAYWWYIRSEQGFEGWAREGDSEDYWIDPLP